MPILHRTTTLTALIPRYASRFSCIGPQCEDTCCSGWMVTLDKKTFKAYRQSGDAQLSARFATGLARTGNGSVKTDYGIIKLDPATGACPLMEERLCAVQKNLDASHLSHTCFSYPRMTRSFAGEAQQGMTLSCPEAARQALLAPDAFDFIAADIEVRADVVGHVVARHGIPLETMNEVRIFCLTLLRTSALALWQRLAVLGVFCESLSRALAEGRHAEVDALVQSAVALVEQGQAPQALGEMAPNYPAQALVFSTLWGGKDFITQSEVQNRVIAAVANGLGADNSGRVSAEQLIERYSRGVQRLPMALEAAPHLLDHYLLNEVFTNLFPFECADPYESYLQLVARFGLLRLMLAAQCAGDERPDAAAMVRTVHVMCRRFQHYGGFAKRVNEALLGSSLGTLEKVYGFLRS
jgi:lysine-N-methylase